MDANIAYLGQIPDWDENDEQLEVGSLQLKRFITLSGIITNLLAGDDAAVDLEVVAIVVLFLNLVSSPRDFFTALHDRYDLKKTSNSTNTCREQKQLKILAILSYWLRADCAASDIYGSLLDTISEFIEEVVTSGTKAVVVTAQRIKVGQYEGV
jgi:hypothetical protein